MARKLIVTREDTADRVIEALAAVKESTLTIVAPRGSALADREGLSQIAERAAEQGIAVAIESVDEELLALAHAAHLETVHPFFRADRRHLSLDGIAPHDRKTPRVPAKAPGEDAVPADDVEVAIESEDRPAHRSTRPLPPHDHPIPTPVAARPARESAPEARPERARRRLPAGRMIAAAVVALALVAGVGEGFFRSGTVEVTLAETPWTYRATVVAATGAGASSAGSLSIPGQLFESQKNVAQSFPATGEPGDEDAPSAARPRVTVHNESPDAETFVVKTRFQGKSGVFRAVRAVSIPAARKEGDTVVPGTATVEVTPDSAEVLSGAEDGERLSIPGLSGTDRASLFYGTLIKPSTSPTPSTTPPAERVVTASDEEAAKAAIDKVLASSFRASLIASQPAGLTVIDGAIEVAPEDITVNKQVDAQGNFNLVGQATLRGLAFREDDLRALLLAQAAAQTGIGYPIAFRTTDISYSEVAPDLEDGRLSFVVEVKGTLVGRVDEAMVREAAAGRSRSEVAEWIRSRPEVAEGSVSASPFWRFSLPADPSRVRVEIR